MLRDEVIKPRDRIDLRGLRWKMIMDEVIKLGSSGRVRKSLVTAETRS
jgi:hypothetical protein